MATPPNDAKRVVGCTNYGIDQSGHHVFFGFKTDGGLDQNFTADIGQLGNIANYMQALTTEAQRRRVATQPQTSDLEVLETQSNPVTNLDVQVDLTGATAALLCMTASGVHHELQLPRDLLEGLLKGIPSLLEEMDRRKAASSQRH